MGEGGGNGWVESRGKQEVEALMCYRNVLMKLYECKYYIEASTLSVHGPSSEARTRMTSEEDLSQPVRTLKVLQDALVAIGRVYHIINRTAKTPGRPIKRAGEVFSVSHSALTFIS